MFFNERAANAIAMLNRIKKGKKAPSLAKLGIAMNPFLTRPLDKLPTFPDALPH